MGFRRTAVDTAPHNDHSGESHRSPSNPEGRHRLRQPHHDPPPQRQRRL